jgi:predicted Zn-dependent protease
MEYSNPEIPEGINTSRQHPLKDFFILTTGILASIALCVFLLSMFAERLALYIPFSVEQKLLNKINIGDFDESDPEIKKYIHDLTLKLLPHMSLPDDVTVDVTYINDSTINAFSTLGGKILIHRGLVESLPNENALAMVIAHEIAHIKHRDPVVALSRGTIVSLFLFTLTGFGTDRLMSNLLTDAGTLSILGFNRNQEKHADEVALATLARYYGHVNGANALFNIFIKNQHQVDKFIPEFFRTHPLSENRNEEIQKLADKNNWPVTGDTVMLPVFINSKN